MFMNDDNEANLDCDPVNRYGWRDTDCASTSWEDGCEACMCFNNGNALWCDGTKSSHYDNYYKDNGVNPFGVSNQSNRKCNTNFIPYGAPCQWDWWCESGLVCSIVRGTFRCINEDD